MDQLYCSEQIVIPPSLPSILKKYVKGAIKTQPYDLLMWSAHYFKAMANGEIPPIKERLEYYPTVTKGQLTFGYLKILSKQLGMETVKKEEIMKRWLCSTEILDNINKIGLFYSDVDMLQFLAISTGFISTNLKRTMILLCELLTEEPEGGSATIEKTIFLKLYKYLARLDLGSINPVTDTKLTSTTSKTPCAKFLEESKNISEENVTDDFDWNDMQNAVNKLSNQMSVETLNQSFNNGYYITETQDEFNKLDNYNETDFPPANEILSIDGLQVWDNVDIPLFFSQNFKQFYIEDKDESFKDKKMNIKHGLDKLMNKERDSVIESEVTPIPHLGRDVRFESIPYDSIKTALIGTESTLGYYNNDDDNKNVGINPNTGLIYTEDEVLEKSSKRRKKSLYKIKNDMVKNKFEEKKFTTIIDKSAKMLSDPKSKEIVLGFSRNQNEMDQIRIITQEKEQELSVGEELHKTTSVLDVVMDTNDLKRFQETVEIEAKKRWHKEVSEFWMYIPGIGPIVSNEIITNVVEYVEYWAEKQQGMIMPRNLRHFLCPPLEFVDTISEFDYTDSNKIIGINLDTGKIYLEEEIIEKATKRNTKKIQKLQKADAQQRTVDPKLIELSKDFEKYEKEQIKNWIDKAKQFLQPEYQENIDKEIIEKATRRFDKNIDRSTSVHQFLDSKIRTMILGNDKNSEIQIKKWINQVLNKINVYNLEEQIIEEATKHLQKTVRQQSTDKQRQSLDLNNSLHDTDVIKKEKWTANVKKTVEQKNEDSTDTIIKKATKIALKRKLKHQDDEPQNVFETKIVDSLFVSDETRKKQTEVWIDDVKKIMETINKIMDEDQIIEKSTKFAKNILPKSKDDKSLEQLVINQSKEMLLSINKEKDDEITNWISKIKNIINEHSITDKDKQHQEIFEDSDIKE